MVNSPAAHQELREKIRDICSEFPNSYWREKDIERGYPSEFVDRLTRSGYLSALIPKQYGGLGLTLTEASIILEEINKSGGNSAACHAQMYTLASLVKNGSEEQKQRYLPQIARGDLRLQAFSVTEPEAGSEVTQIITKATKTADGSYLINGFKNWTSRVQESDLLILLARTTPKDQIKSKTDGLSLFLIDLQQVRKEQPGAVTVTPVRTMITYATNQIRYENLKIPADALIGEEGEGFRYALDGWNAERILLASEAIGDGYWFIEQASQYANDRIIFGRQLGSNQGIQFPIAKAYSKIRAADLMRLEAAAKFDRGESCGPEANMAKLLSAEASWEAANICLDTFGGYGFVDEYNVERKFRETRLYKVAPVADNMVLSFLATKVLGLPRSH